MTIDPRKLIGYALLIAVLGSLYAYATYVGNLVIYLGGMVGVVLTIIAKNLLDDKPSQ